MGFFTGEKTDTTSSSTSGNKFAEELANWSRGQAGYALGNQSPIVRPNETGFMPYQMAGLNVFLRNLYGQSSGDWASRGFNLPYNEGAVAGSALTQALPNLFALQNQNQLLPGTIVGQNVGNVMGALNPMLAGGQYSTSTSRSRGRGAGLGYGFLTGGGAGPLAAGGVAGIAALAA